MHFFNGLVVLWAIYPSFVLGGLPAYAPYGQGGQTFWACDNALATYATLCNETAIEDCFCLSDVGIATLAGCFAYKKRNTTSNLKYWTRYCKEYYDVILSSDQIAEGYAYYESSALATDEIEDFNATIPIDVPLKLAGETMRLYEAAYLIFVGNYDDSLYYGAGVLGYWGLVIVISIVFHWTNWLFPTISKHFDGHFSRMWRKYVTLPALAKRKRAESQSFIWVLEFLVPSRLESIVIFFFFWFCFAINTVNIYYVKQDPLMPLRGYAINRYVADRSGIVCTVITPLLVLFGGRNNFVQYLTGWKFSTVIAYHRWIARLVMLMAFIHSVCYTVLLVDDGNYAISMAENYLVWGTVSTVCGSLMCVQGLLFLRRKWYEVFLVLHIALAVFFLVGLYYHVDTLGYIQLIYPSFAIWGFDRFMRLVRLFMFGIPQSTVSLVSDDTIKVVVNKPKYWKFAPGGHAWIYFPRGFIFWQSHPFTLIDNDDGTITFFCKIKNGLTKALEKKLANQSGKSLQMKVGVEGPYGEAKILEGYSNAVFIAGGNGIPGLYNEITYLEKKGESSKQVLKLIWIIREMKTLTWFWEHLQKLEITKIETTVYLTRPDVLNETEDLIKLVSSESEAEQKNNDLPLLEQIKQRLPHVEFKEGRPSMESIVVSEISQSANSTAFIACGRPQMVDEVRYQVVNQIDKSQKRINFFDALEVWT